MPHPPCSICLHPDRARIDVCLKAGHPPLRTLAGQFGVSRSALDRHSHEHVIKPAVQQTDAKGIDAEILKLLRAQGKAKRLRDSRGLIKISGELRQWYALKAKVEALAAGTNKPQDTREVSRSEAVAAAKSIIEAELASDNAEILEWLQILVERFEATKVSTCEANVESKPSGFSAERRVADPNLEEN